MCGIVGVWGDCSSSLIQSMKNKMIHRGPDAEGVSGGACWGLGHRRLSIMDIDGGNQPISSMKKGFQIAANGEIYNHPQLSKKLKQIHNFSTRSDSETPLHLYEDIGVETASKLDGMFSFIIANEKEFYAARDVVGIKPLYYGSVGEALVFSSELKSFSGHADSVKEFPPGTWFHSEKGFKKYSGIPRIQPEDRSIEEYCILIRETLERAVVKRLMSDVPVGAFLSGGLDSSIIAALARKHVKQLHTFSVGIEGSPDIEAARKVSKYLDTIHHEHIFTRKDILDNLPEIIYYLESFDQDLVRSGIPCYFTSRLASDYVKVILTGEGADELFAGYKYYKEVEKDDILHDELHRSVSTLHNLNLQRVDRLTMAHSVEARVPFLDLDFITAAQKIPSSLKLLRNTGKYPVEKWILRKAFEDVLPGEIVWREKEQFDEGSGTVDLLSAGLEQYMPESEWPAYSNEYSSQKLRSFEEGVFHKIVSDVYSNPEIIYENCARWEYQQLSNKV